VEAILLVGGQGSRLSPLTLTTPKPMLPVANVPFTAHQIAKAKAAGITKIILSTSYKSEVFEGYFANGENFGIEIQYVTEESPLGTGGAIRNVSSALESSADEPVFIFNGDILSGHSLEKQLANFQTNNAAVSLHLIEVEDPRPFGLVPTNSAGFVTQFLEKPTDDSQIVTNQVNAGCYIFRKSVIDSIRPNAVVSVEREVFPNLLEANQPIIGYVDNAYWLDLGTPASYLKGNLDVVTGVCESPLVPNVGESLISSQAGIGSNVKVSGGSAINAETLLQNGTSISRSVVMSGCKIGENVNLEDCIIGNNVSIAANLSLKNVVVADGAVLTTQLAAGSKVDSAGQII
jgi:mannose-1-phosphate guanylyltransferase